MKEFLNSNTFKWILLITGAIVAIAIWRGCGNEKSTDVLEKLTILQKEKDSIYIVSNSRISILAQENERLRTERDTARNLADARLREIKRFKPTVIRLAGEVITHTDSAKCDSLARYVIQADEMLADMLALMLNATAYGDSIEAVLSAQLDEFKLKLQACDRALNYAVNTVIPVLKPRGELYIGGDIIGNRSTLFSGYGANLNWLTTKGKMYTVGSEWINGEQYYKAGVKLRLSLRKH